MKKPYDYQKDRTFCPPAIVRTSNVRVSEENVSLVRDFFSDLIKKNHSHEVMCFVRKESENGEIARESRKVSASTFDLKVGSVFRYVHTVGVSERVIINEKFDDVLVESVYTISG